MNELLYFYLENCPHCKKSDKLLAELISENAEFSKITITKIEERKSATLANSYDYYYVPSFFLNDEKLHEGAITKSALELVLKKALC